MTNISMDIGGPSLTMNVSARITKCHEIAYWSHCWSEHPWGGHQNWKDSSSNRRHFVNCIRLDHSTFQSNMTGDLYMKSWQIRFPDSESMKDLLIRWQASPMSSLLANCQTVIRVVYWRMYTYKSMTLTPSCADIIGHKNGRILTYHNKETRNLNAGIPSISLLRNRFCHIYPRRALRLTHAQKFPIHIYTAVQNIGPSKIEYCKLDDPRLFDNVS